MDITIFFDTVTTSIMILGGLIQCTIMFAKQNELRNLFNQIDTNWQKLGDVRERVIFFNFARQGRFVGNLFLVSSISLYAICIIITNIPAILGEITKDVMKIFPYYSKNWIIDERLWNLQVFVHLVIASFYSVVLYLVIVITYLCSIKHFCGIYAIATYRLKSLTSTKHSKNIIPELIAIMMKHKEAIKGIRAIDHIFGKVFFFAEICFLPAFAFVLFDIRSNLFNLRLLLRVSAIGIGFFMHSFCINYGGEMVIHFSSKMRLATFFIQWYLIPLEARKLLLVIIGRCQRPDTLGWVNMTYSHKNIVNIIKTSWSLAAVLIAIHGVK